MPNLPSYGWLDRCEDCDIITSRLMSIKHKNKSQVLYVCQKCRFNLIEMLLIDFNIVIITKETVGQVDIMVSQ